MISTSLLLVAIATVGGIEITQNDAEQLRALLSPPPSRVAAQRLAVDTARAHLWLRGWLEYSSPRARLEAYRVLLATVRRSTPDAARLAARITATLDQVESGWHPPLARIAPPAERQWIADLLPNLGPTRDVSLLRMNRDGPLELLLLGAVRPHQLAPELARQLERPVGPRRSTIDHRGREVAISR